MLTHNDDCVRAVGERAHSRLAVRRRVADVARRWTRQVAEPSAQGFDDLLCIMDGVGRLNGVSRRRVSMLWKARYVGRTFHHERSALCVTDRSFDFGMALMSHQDDCPARALMTLNLTMNLAHKGADGIVGD